MVRIKNINTGFPLLRWIQISEKKEREEEERYKEEEEEKNYYSEIYIISFITTINLFKDLFDIGRLT